MFQEETLAHKLITKGFWLYFLGFVIAPFGYIIRLIISNDLEPEELGIIYSLLGLMGLISTYHDLGLTEALTYFLPKFWINKEYNHFKTVIIINFIIQFTIGGLIAIGIYNGANYLAIHYFHTPNIVNIIKIFCLYFFLINIFRLFGGIFTTFQDVIANKIIDFCRLIVILTITLYFFLTHQGNLFNYSIVRIIGMGVAFVVCLFFSFKYAFTLRQGKFQFDKIMLKEYFIYSMRVLIGSNAGMILGQIDQQMIIYYLGSYQAGLYSNYLSLTQIYNLVLTPIISLVFPITCELIQKNQHTKLNLLINILYKYLGIFAVSVGCLITILGPILAVIFFGLKYLQSGLRLLYTGIFICINILLQINFSILPGLGQVSDRVKFVIKAALANIIINYFLIRYIGTIGAVITMIIGWIYMFWASYKLITKQFQIQFDQKFWKINILYILIYMIILILLLDNIFIFSDQARWHNLGYLILVVFVYYIGLAGVNYKSIFILKNEINKIWFKN